jgi:hypothetical protein
MRTGNIEVVNSPRSSYTPSSRTGPIRVLKIADSKMEVGPEHCLRGKVNFIAWKREFEREAKAYDVLYLVTGDEEILEKPQKWDYIDNDDDKDTISIASTQKTLKNFHASGKHTSLHHRLQQPEIHQGQPQDCQQAS